MNADGTLDVGIRHNLGVSKVKLPHVVQKHASHVLRKAVDNIDDYKTIPNTVKRCQTQHELNLILGMIAATATAWLFIR